MIFIEGKTKTQYLNDRATAYGYADKKEMFPMNISLPCGCKFSYQTAKQFPAKSVKCEHGNFITKYV